MLTERDRDILLTLTHKVRVLSLSQLARTWWSETAAGLETARRRLRRLAVDGWLTQLPVNAHPELPLAGPLYRWAPGEPAPNCYQLERRCRSRWKEPARRAAVYLATRQAAARLGGVGGRLKHPLQTDHDLHVGTVYLRLLHTDPAMADLWVSEALVAPERRGQKLPDAIVKNPDGSVRLVVEFAGQYDAKRIAAVHEDCAARETPYELW